MTKRRPPSTIPVFSSEAEEREFWETHDTSPFVKWSEARAAVFPNLKPSTQTISLRLPSALLAELKALANRRDVPYQSLLKVFLAERVARETASNALTNKRLQRAKARRRGGVKRVARARVRG